METPGENNKGAPRSGMQNGGCTPEQRSWVQTLTLILATAAAVVGALYMFVPPAVVSADAPATEFSAQRAMEDVRAIAREPHPMGSVEHEEAADRIVSRLEDLGLSPRVQQTSSLRYDDEGFAGDQVHAARLKNILARIPGTENTGEAVLLMSHYDSMPTTPAAADGGVGTATLLETVRAIQAGPSPKNDVIIYIGDADVNGVLGPIALHKHRWSNEAKVGFAFEGIGSSGPSALVYDTQGAGRADRTPGIDPAQVPVPEDYPSARDGWWLREALKALPYPLVILPLNQTPFAVGVSPELGLFQVGTDAAGLGFGQFRESYAYHTLLDSPERLDPRSLQHQGSNALALARHFGDASLQETNRNQSAPLVAFNVLPGQVVSYPSTWTMPLAVACALFFVVVLALGLWRRRLRVSGLLLGLLLFVVSLVGAAAVTTLGWNLGAALNPAYRTWMVRGYYGSDWRLLFLASLTLAFVAALYLLARRFVRAARHEASLGAGTLLVLVALAVLTGAGVPSISYLFTWPTLAGVIVLAFGVLTPARARGGWPSTVVLTLSALVPIVLFVPLIYFFYAFFAAPLAGPGGLVPPVVVVFVLLALMLGALLAQLLYFLGGRRAWAVPATFAALAIVFFAGELVTTRLDADYPRTNYVQYRLDADSGEATWISDTNPPDAWTEQFFTEGYERGREAFAPVYYYGQRFEVVRAPAPEVDLPAPRLEVVKDTMSGGVRTLGVRLSSPRGAPYAHLEMANLPAEWMRASVDGEEIDVSKIPAQSRRRFAMTFYNLPEDGIEMTLSVRSARRVEAVVTDYSNGLPDVPGMEIEPRPPAFMPAPYDFRDPTAIERTFEL